MFNYFPIAVVKHRDQGSVQESRFNWVCVSRGLDSP